MKVVTALLVTLIISTASLAQTTAFTYQGRLSDTEQSANGSYDFEFKLYEAGGAQVGATLTRNDVVVRDGVFTVSLNFNVAAFTGDERKLEIAVRRGAETGAYTPLAPRQSITSAPYAIRAVNATNSENAMYAVNSTQAAQAGEALTAQNSLQLGGVPAGQYVRSNSTEFVRNRTTPQTSTNFNIDGTGTASIFSAGTGFNIGSNRILSNAGTDNLFAGVGAGSANTTGAGNSFFGKNAGQANTTGSNNTIVGDGANVAANNLDHATAIGADAIVGTNNTIVLGRNLDTVQVPGNVNVAGALTGSFTVPATNVTGVLAVSKGGTGLASPGASGYYLRSNGTGFYSSPIEASDLSAGNPNYVQNTTVQQPSTNFNIGGNGTAGGTLSGNVVNATMQINIGGVPVLSKAGTDNFFAGYGAGGENTIGLNNAFFGRNAGQINSEGSRNSMFGKSAGFNNTTGSNNSFFGTFAGSGNSTGSNNTAVGDGANVGLPSLSFATAIGAGARVDFSNTVVLGRSLDTVRVPGNLNVTGTITGALPAGSTNYIHNSANTQQASTNFNISGDGIAGGTLRAKIITADTQYNIGISRVLSIAGSQNVFAGLSTGQSNTTGAANSFFGSAAGFSNISGSSNSFYGASAGRVTTSGGDNSFFGSYAGQANTTNSENSFFGSVAGFYSTGRNNSFFGKSAGYGNTTGGYNAFFGTGAGDTNTTGSNNTVIGTYADVEDTNLTYATAIGAGTIVKDSNTIALGRTDGSDKVVINGIAVGGYLNICLNLDNYISSCSSSLRYKTNITPFSFGLNVVNQLRPISFDWTKGGMKDVGFGAEDVARINPLFVTYNKAGEVEGVKYDRLSVAFVNAFKEQQAQIETQREQINRQQQQINELKEQQAQLDALKATVCALKPDAAVCKETNK
jgi:hypothetical protein